MCTIQELRILHVINHFYPVLGYQETFLARSHGHNHKCLLITSDRYEKRVYVPNKHLLKKKVIGPGLFKESGIKTLRLPTLFDIEPLNEPWLIGLEHAVVDFKPDVIIVHGLVNINSIRIARLKLKLQNTKLIVDDHMTYNATREFWPRLLYKVFKKIFTPMLLKSVDSFVAVTYETKRFMQEIYGIPSEKITVIPLGVDRSRFYCDPDSRKAIRRKYGINDIDIVFIYVGKIVPEKGAHILINAALKLCKNYENVKFLFVGGKDCKYFSSLKRKLLNTKMEERFIFLDSIPNLDLYKYYLSADAGVWPLQCSVAMLEATACGLPIIISDKSGAVERVSWGNGLLYKEADSYDLASKLTLLLDDKLRKKMSKISLAYAETLDWKDLAQRYLDICLDKED